MYFSKFKCIAIALLLTALPAFAAMSDLAALAKAQQTWGSQAMIGTGRFGTQSNWTKLVGFHSIGCQEAFTAVGSGFNTWEAAFLDSDAHPFPIAGPYKGTMTIKAQVWDNVAVSGAQFFIDSVSRPQLLPPTIAPYFIAEDPIDTTQLAPGIHVACVQAWDQEQNRGRSHAFLFRVDQTAGTAGTFFVNEPLNGPPSAGPITIAQN